MKNFACSAFMKRMFASLDACVCDACLEEHLLELAAVALFGLLLLPC